LAGFISYQLLGPLQTEASRDVAALAWVTPAAWLFFIQGCMGFVLAFSKWRGDYKLRLLLRLISEHENKDS
jgi:hypothetical protein